MYTFKVLHLGTQVHTLRDINYLMRGLTSIAIQNMTF